MKKNLFHHQMYSFMQVFGNFSSLLPNVDPDGASVQLKEFCKICRFTHTATFFLCFSGQIAYVSCSILILQRASLFHVDHRSHREVQGHNYKTTTQQQLTHIFSSFC